MPSITILEDDLTRATGSSITDIPFIPGLATSWYKKTSDKSKESDKTYYTKEDGVYTQFTETSFAANTDYYEEKKPVYGKAIYCATVSDLEENFGPNPYIFDVAQTFPDSSSKNISLSANELDRSYVMAKELLSAGMPIYYWASEATNTIKLVYKSPDSDGLPTGVIINQATEVGKSTFTIKNTNANSTDVTINVTLSRPLLKDEELTISLTPATTTIKTISGDDTKWTISKPKVKAKKDGAQDITLTLTVPQGNTEVTLSATFSTNSTIIESFYTKLTSYLSLDLSNGDDCLLDKGEYNIKYITSGGYPNYGVGGDGDIYSKMLTIAEKRGDCIALVEHINSENQNPKDAAFISSISGATIDPDEYGAAFTPWADYQVSTKIYDANNRSLVKINLPACYGYLRTIAQNIKTVPNWLAMAGVTRGLVPNIDKLNTNGRLSNVLADNFQPTATNRKYTRAVNAITDIKPYGLCIWGNRTLKTVTEDGLTATNFLNIRSMMCDIKKTAYKIAKELIFEQNNEALWLSFKSRMSPLLESMKAGAGISDYKLIKLPTHYNGKSLGKEEFACAIKIFPLYAIEAFEITVIASDDDVAVN